MSLSPKKSRKVSPKRFLRCKATEKLIETNGGADVESCLK